MVLLYYCIHILFIKEFFRFRFWLIFQRYRKYENNKKKSIP